MASASLTATAKITDRTAARGQIITFYSYKGGTGRSMALANVACLLAQEQVASGGKPVLAIDWDLEAPGLHRYFDLFLPPEGADNDVKSGVIELFYDIRTRVRVGCAPDEEEVMSENVVRTLDLRAYVIPTEYPKLSFMKAGHFDASYPTRTNTFDWDALNQNAPSIFRMLAERLAEEYSYVLIDSRTGITDTSGICTTLMPEKLVVVFTPNQQSLTGIVDFVARAYAYRRGSEDLRGLVVYPLPSRIETSLPEYMERWRYGDPQLGPVVGWELQFTDLLRNVYQKTKEFSLGRYFNDVQVQHVAPYAFGEPIAVLRERGAERLSLTRSYETFCRYLQRSAPWDDGVSLADELRVVERERMDRLNEEFRAAAEARPAAAAQWATSELAKLGLAILCAVLFGAAVFTVLWNVGPGATRVDVLGRVLNDASLSRPSTTILLLGSILPQAKGQDRTVVLDQLRSRLALMPPMLYEIPLPGAQTISLTDDVLLILDRNGHVQRFDSRTSAKLPAPEGIYLAAVERAAGPAVVRGRVLRVYQGTEWTEQAVPADLDLYMFSPRGRLLLYGKRPEQGAGTGIGVVIVGASDQGEYGDALYQVAEPLAKTLAASAFSGDESTVAIVRRDGSVAVTRGYLSADVVVRESSLVALDTRGRHIAVMSADGPAIFEVSTKRTISTLPAYLSQMAFDPSGETLVGIIPVNTLAQFDVGTGVQLGVSPAGERMVQSIAFMEDGRLLTAFTDRIEIAQPLARNNVTTIETDARPILQTAFSTYGIAVATADSVMVWRLGEEQNFDQMSDKELITETCRRAARDLTPEEWQNYFGSTTQDLLCSAENRKALKNPSTRKAPSASIL